MNEEGQKKWAGDRVAAVTVNGLRLIPCYQPLWDHGDQAREVYLRELEDQLLNNKDESMIKGGDHNSHMGKCNCDHFNPGTKCPFSLCPIDHPGIDFLHWCDENGLSWTDSVKWKNVAPGTAH